MSRDDELFDQLGQVLEHRPGWRYEPSTSPGGQPSWCRTSEGEILLGVTVLDGVHSVYLPDQDREIDFDDRDGLVAWLDEHADPSAGR